MLWNMMLKFSEAEPCSSKLISDRSWNQRPQMLLRSEIVMLGCSSSERTYLENLSEIVKLQIMHDTE